MCHRTQTHGLYLGNIKVMPITHRVDRDSGIVRTTVTGSFELSDLRRYLGQAVDDKVFSYPAIIDARGVDPASLRPKELLRAANLVRDASHGRDVPPRAIIVDSRSHFGQARIFAGFLAGVFRVAVFEDCVEAERWIASQMASQEA